MEDFSLKEVSFDQPYWLILLLLIPLVTWITNRKLRKKPTIRYSSIEKFRTINGTWKVKFYWLPQLAFHSGLLLAIVSLARPQLDKSSQSIVSSGVDIVLAVDLSASMLALDMSPSAEEPSTRLDVVKEVIKEFIKKRKFDRIGLVAFAVNPYLVSALTLDKEYLDTNLNRLEVGLTEQTGTNIGSALAEGINRLRTLDSKSKVLILLTDGKDEPQPTHSPLIYAEGAIKDKIKIYTIAIGTNSRTRTYLYDPNARDLMRYANGMPVIDVADYPVDKKILKQISEVTNAKSFEARDKESLSSIYEEINKLEKTDVQLEVNALFEDLYQWPLSIGSLLIFVGFILDRTLFLRIP
jgi:Ca-activated chloride channel family protein